MCYGEFQSQYGLILIIVHEEQCLQDEEFQSQYGLILIHTNESVAQVKANISIPIWSDFNRYR